MAASFPTPSDFKEISPEKIARTVQQIEQKIENNPKASTKAKVKSGYIKDNFSSNPKKYQEQEKILGARSSYDKTDPDATFMRMKDDYMRNGRLKLSTL